MPITWYDSLETFMKALPDKSYAESQGARDSADYWNDFQTYADARERCLQGDAKAIRAAEKMLLKLESEGLELAMPHIAHDRVGFMPCVPSYLAGSPESMLSLQDFPTESSPIKILIDPSGSAGFGGATMNVRGAALLCLALKLQQVRPIELYVYDSMNGRDKRDGTGNCAIPVIRLNSNPMDLATASYVLGNVAFTRQLTSAWGGARGFNGKWAWNGSPSADHDKMHRMLGLEPQDMLIDGAYFSDPAMKDPVKWVNQQVRKYATVLEDSA